VVYGTGSPALEGPAYQPHLRRGQAAEAAIARMRPPTHNARACGLGMARGRRDCSSGPWGRRNNTQKTRYDPRVSLGPVGPCSTRGYHPRFRLGPNQGDGLV